MHRGFTDVLCARVDVRAATTRADFVQLATGGLLKQPLQSSDHRCGKFNSGWRHGSAGSPQGSVGAT